MLKILIIIYVLFFSITKSYANDLVVSDSSKTIRELKESIESDKTKSEIHLKLKDFSPDQKLNSFFRDDLNAQDIWNVKLIIEQYNKSKENLEDDLLNKSKQLLDTSSIKVKLLEEKKKFYIDLTKYIKMDQYQSYLDYIKSDTTIDSNIYRKQELVNTKVTILEEKIKEHKENLEDSLQKLVENKMDEKVYFLSQNVNFSNLDNNEKIKILDKSIYKIDWLIEKMKSDNLNLWTSNFIKSNNIKKIEIYNIVLNKLESFKNTYK